MEGAPSSMHPCPVPPKPSEGMGRTGQGTGTASSAPCGITLRRWKVLFGNTVNLPTEMFPPFRWSAAAGRPHLLLGDDRGPAISFSEGGGNVWAALCGDESDIGIDAAGTDEFTREYPLDRVFHPQELQHALRLTGGDLEQASALLWSVKEAVVKALGCAFHLVDPRQITVFPSAEGAAGENGGVTFPVGLSGKSLARFPVAAGRSLWVRSLPRRKMWLSIALLNRQHG